MVGGCIPEKIVPPRRILDKTERVLRTQSRRRLIHNATHVDLFMAIKQRTITLTQETDNSFRVSSWSNSAELAVGMIISRAKLDAWCAMPGVQVNVRGMTQVADSGQQSALFPKAGLKAVTAVIAAK